MPRADFDYRIESNEWAVSDMIHAFSLPGSSIQIAKNDSRPSSTVIRYPLHANCKSSSKDGAKVVTLVLRANDK